VPEDEHDDELLEEQQDENMQEAQPEEAEGQVRRESF
jgi:hypothetical protein